MEKKHKEIMELKHETEPGYRTVFYIVSAAAGLYLSLILLRTI